ncbi:unnamed protein product [Didymodactylos carnosus]|uniref:Glycosyltransferase 2-like domain-containing protein n=1 Tax=Didymodactylos carnosus TaxID=1234261 RepID=A0A815HFV3_9BILA|nr:unnamed protein product [Didymodactylos carnosus]CAF4225408.1 unnamed protein product [Didymodactylos carnosus]
MTLVLSQLCLCTIVKNEIDNESGGIIQYCHQILPYLKYAIIIDTGSTDQTFQALQELQSHSSKFYHNLNFHVRRSVHPKFMGFAQARNESLEWAWKLFGSQEHHEQPSHILILDADERLTIDQLNLIDKTLNVISNSDTSVSHRCDCSDVQFHESCLKFSIQCFNRLNDPVARSNSGLLNPRIFPFNSKFRFINQISNIRFERLVFDNKPLPRCYLASSSFYPIHIILHHYILNSSQRRKKNEWYKQLKSDDCIDQIQETITNSIADQLESVHI